MITTQLNGLTPNQMMKLRRFISDELGVSTPPADAIVVIAGGGKAGGIAFSSRDPKIKSDVRKLKSIISQARSVRDGELAQMAEHTLIAQLNGTTAIDRPL